MHSAPLLIGTALLFLPACASSKSGSSNGVGETENSAWYPDLDGDGFGDASATATIADDQPPLTVANADDCDDQDFAVHPGADEICNMVDDDCNGLVDDNPVDGLEWVLDADGDGYGDDSAAFQSCEQPDGAVLTGGDCDDTDPAIHPEAEEICDGIDNDCDGRIDGSDVDDPPVWCIDADGDGYGSDADGAESMSGCDPSDGYAACDDCDDGDEDVSPAALELCGNDTDENCDGINSDCSLWGTHGSSDADASLYGEGDGALGSDSAGVSVSSGDVNGDGFEDLWIGASGSDLGATFGGAVYLVKGPVTGSWPLRDEAEAELISDTDSTYAGRWVRSAGDVNSDGYDDVWVGAPDEAPGGTASLFFGPVSGTVHLEDAELHVVSDTISTLGASVTGGGDLDGDGLVDGAVSGPELDIDGMAEAGAVWLVYNRGLAGVVAADATPVTLEGAGEESYLGSAMAMLGDTTGDGSDDLAMSQGLDTWLLTDPMDDGTYVANDVTQPVRHLSSAPDARVGQNLASMGDLNGDGYADFSTSQPESDLAYAAGIVYIIYGPWGGRSTVAEADIAILGETYDAWAGPAAGGQDIDQDGNPDVVIGAPAIETDDDHGHVYLFHGPLADGTTLLSGADATIAGAWPGSEAGWDVAQVGDTNDDGYPDLLIGSPADLTGSGGDVHSGESGAAFLFFGESFPSAIR